MNTSDKRIFQRAVFGMILACLALAASGFAQDTSTTGSYQSGRATVTTEVKSAEVVYVSGNDVVVKMDDGQIKHAVVPDDKKITVDGKELTVHQLQPGMHLTKTITTTSTPRTVMTVRKVNGRVWYVNPPTTLILTLPDGTNKQYKASKGQKFEMNGKMHDLFDIHKGDVISATAITESPEVVDTTSNNVSGTAPPPPPDVTPAPVTAILIEAPAPEPQQTAEATLPKTGSTVPLLGFLGFICVGMYFASKALRA
jgi:hypothetical protein